MIFRVQLKVQYGGFAHYQALPKRLREFVQNAPHPYDCKSIAEKLAAARKQGVTETKFLRACEAASALLAALLTRETYGPTHPQAVKARQ